jgi:predicted DNA-binding protein
MDNEPRVKMTTYVPEALRRRLKVVAAATGTTAAALVERAVQKELDRIEGPSRETTEFIARHTTPEVSE